MNTDSIYGALLGDFIGSVYEFDHQIKPSKEDAVLFRPGDSFTDDSVMTIAIAECLYNRDSVNIDKYLRRWGHRYPDAGYGSMFHDFVVFDMPIERQSYGNGAAMRISAVAPFSKDIEDCKRLAKAVTETTHGHPEGIKGATTIAVCDYMALHGAKKAEILEYAKQFYDVEAVDYEALRKSAGHGREICQVTVPQALYCFEHSESFEDCMRMGVSMGQDCDTLLAIAGSIAGAYYGIPKGWKEKLDITPVMKTVLDRIEIL